MQGVEVIPLGVILFLPVWAVVVVSCCVGGLVGAVNGVLIAWFKVPAFVATRGVMYVARGVALLQTNGLTYNNLQGRADLGNTGEILERVERHAGLQCRADYKIGQHIQQRVPIRCGLGDRSRSNNAAPARPVIYHHRPPPAFAQLQADHARHRVGLTAGRAR